MDILKSEEFYRDFIHHEDTGKMYSFSVLKRISKNIIEVINDTIKWYIESDKTIDCSSNLIRIINIKKYLCLPDIEYRIVYKIINSKAIFGSEDLYVDVIVWILFNNEFYGFTTRTKNINGKKYYAVDIMRRYVVISKIDFLKEKLKNA